MATMVRLLGQGSKLRDRILDVIKSMGEATTEDVARELGLEGKSLWEARKILSSLINEGLLERIPDYGRRRIVFRLRV